jgi:hypothetical protein
MIELGPKTLSSIKGILTDYIDTYGGEMSRAYVKQDGELSVAISLKFQPGKGGATVLLTHKIGFVSDRIKDGDVVEIDEKQLDLFTDTKGDKNGQSSRG